MTNDRNKLNQILVPKGLSLYFDEEAHKYSDNLGNAYTSTTTMIGQYYEKFDKKAQDIAAACERIGKNPNHPKYLHYRGKTAKQLLYEWEQETKRACDKGSKKHFYLETAINKANGYTVNANGFINGKIYTIDNIIKGHKYGRLNLKFFELNGVKDKYPEIYNLIKNIVKDGFRIYAEIGVYDPTFLVSGLVDVLFVRGNEFMILDWKTNKAPIMFDAGYYEKFPDGTLNLSKFIHTEQTFYHPLSHLADSVGNHYTLQLSTYDYLVESFGFKCLGNILCHIRTIEKPKSIINPNDIEEEQEEVTFYNIKYLKSDVIDMLSHNINKRRAQDGMTLFN